MSAFTAWMGTPRAVVRRLAFATLAGLFMGLIGPFGSYGVPSAVRLVCWTISFWAGAVIFSVVLRAAERWRLSVDCPAWFAWPAGVIVAAAPLSAIAAALFTGLSPRRPDLGPLDWYVQTLVIAAPLSLGYLAFHLTGDRPPATPVMTAPAPSAFLDRLPPRLGRDLLALQMEDHYVRAHTLRGSELVLTPMREAVTQLGGLEGRRVHRSWWVARAAVESVEADGRNMRLRLKGGLTAPVARNAVATLARSRLAAAPRVRPNDSPSQMVNGGACR